MMLEPKTSKAGCSKRLASRIRLRRSAQGLRVAFYLVCGVAAAVALSTPLLSQEEPATSPTDPGQSPVEVDDMGLPLSRDRGNRSPQTTRAPGTPPTSAPSSGGWGQATPRDRGTDAWGSEVIDRTPAELPEGQRAATSCSLSIAEATRALQQADQALANRNLDRWVSHLLPLVQSGCNGTEVASRLARAKRIESASSRQRDRKIREATAWRSSRLRSDDVPEIYTDLDPGPSRWIEVVDQLSTLARTIQTARDPGRYVVYNVEQYTDPRSGPTFEPSIEDVRPPDTSEPTAGLNPLLPGGSADAGYTTAAASECGGTAPAGTQCMCRQEPYGVASCGWRTPEGDRPGGDCRSVPSLKCYTHSNANSCLADSGPRQSGPRTFWVARTVRDKSNPAYPTYKYDVCWNSGTRPSGKAFLGEILARPTEVLNSYEREGDAIRAAEEGARQCNAAMIDAAARALQKDFSQCRP